MNPPLHVTWMYQRKLCKERRDRRKEERKIIADMRVNMIHIFLHIFHTHMCVVLLEERGFGQVCSR